MAWSFVAAGTVQNGANPTVPVPTGYAQGDLLVIASYAGAAPITPSGWTILLAAPSNTAVYYKTAGASESSVAFSAPGAGTTVMLAWRGVSAFDTNATSSSGTSVTSLATHTLSAAQANELVISLFFSKPAVAGTWTAPGSTNNRVQFDATASYPGLLVVDENQTSAGTSTARTASFSVSTDLSSVAMAFTQLNNGFFGFF